MKKEYRVSNWTEYNKSLVNRGRIDLWVDFELLSNEEIAYGGYGRPQEYSEYLIMVLSCLRSMFNLPLRYLEGFASLMLKIEKVPNYSTICKRLKEVKMELPRMRAGSVLAIDATGLKVLGDGEWLRYKHGKQRKRRWEKVTIAIDIETGQVIAHHNMDGNSHDVNAVESIASNLKQSATKASLVLADGAYDNRRSYDALAGVSNKVLIPPRHKAKVWDGYQDRNKAIHYIHVHGRYSWAKHSGYTMRNRVEAAIARLKRTFSPALRSKTFLNKKAELATKIAILNHFSALGRAQSYLVS